MDFVWIYVKCYSYFSKFGIWNELEYSIKSVRKNYPNARCWVVGDDPGLDVNFISVDRLTNHNSGHHIDIDVIRKFRVIIDSEIDDEFVLMYDDIYILQPVTYKDFKITYARCKVDDVMSYQRAWSRSYRMMWQNTYKIIENIVDEVYDWETHMPRLYDKDLLEQVIDAYNCDNIPLLATSLYAAHYVKKTKILTAGVQLNLMNTQVTDYDKAFKAKFMNIMDESITKEFKDKMTEVFGEGTSFKPPYRRY